MYAVINYHSELNACLPKFADMFNIISIIILYSIIIMLNYLTNSLEVPLINSFGDSLNFEKCTEMFTTSFNKLY